MNLREIKENAPIPGFMDVGMCDEDFNNRFMGLYIA